MTFFVVSVLVLAALLFYPVSRLIWVTSVRRLQRKTGAALSDQAIQGQMSRARFVAIFLCLLFSYLFNLNVIGMPVYGG